MSQAHIPGPQAVDDLLFAGLDEHWRARCRVWVDDAKHRFGVSGDRDAVAAYTEAEVAPLVDLACRVFGIGGFEDIRFVGLPTPRFAAVAARIGEQPFVGIHEGLLAVLRLWVAQHHVLEALGETGGEDMHHRSRALLHTTQGMAIRFLIDPFRWADPLMLLPPERRSASLTATVAALAFVVGHELTHHRAGHTEFALSGWGDSEFDPAHLLLAEQLFHSHEQEFEADRGALSLATAERHAYVAGAGLFLSGLAVSEGIRGRDGRTHPFALNRLGALRRAVAAQSGDDPGPLFAGLDELARLHVGANDFHDRALEGWAETPAEAAVRLEAMMRTLFGVAYKNELTRDLCFDQCWAAGPAVAARIAPQLAGLSDHDVQGTTIGSLVAIVERFLHHRQLGHRGLSLARVEAERAAASGRRVDPQALGSLEAYVRCRLQVDHPTAEPMPEGFLEQAVERTLRHWSW